MCSVCRAAKRLLGKSHLRSRRERKKGREEEDPLLKFPHFGVDSHFNSSKVGELARGDGEAELEDSKAILLTKVPWAASRMGENFQAEIMNTLHISSVHHSFKIS